MLGKGILVADVSVASRPRGHVMTHRVRGTVLSCVGSSRFHPRFAMAPRRVDRLFAGATNSVGSCAGSSPSRLGPGVGWWRSVSVVGRVTLLTLKLLTALKIRTRACGFSFAANGGAGSNCAGVAPTSECSRRGKCKCSERPSPRNGDATPFFFSIAIPSKGCRIATIVKGGHTTKRAAIQKRSHHLFFRGIGAGGKRLGSYAFIVGGHGARVSRGRGIHVGPHRHRGLG